MKKYIFKTLLMVCLLQMLGCVGVTESYDKYTRIYRLENGTPHEIKMEFYTHGHQYPIHRQTMGEGSIFERSGVTDRGYIRASGVFNADSVIVIFDNAKIMTYTNISLKNRVNINPSDRNFLLDDAYEDISNELYRFVFTEQDYSNAGEIDGGFHVDIVYKNETNHVVCYYKLINNHKTLLFKLSPDAERVIATRASGGSNHLTVNDCCQRILEDFQDDDTVVIEYYNNDKCITYTNEEGSKNLSAYEGREIEPGHYKFIYRFTETEYSQAENCN